MDSTRLSYCFIGKQNRVRKGEGSGVRHQAAPMGAKVSCDHKFLEQIDGGDSSAARDKVARAEGDLRTVAALNGSRA